MISRRSFLKYAGLAAVAAGSGFTAGKISSQSSEEYFTLQGFIPEDEKILGSLFTAVKKNIRSGSEPDIIAPGFDTKGILKLYGSGTTFSNNGKVVIRMNRLDERMSSDILLSDNGNHIYDPGKDYTVLINSIRGDLRNKPADIFLSIEYKETGFISSLIKSPDRNVVMLNNKGIAEKINLSVNYSKVIIPGAVGNTIVSLHNGAVRVTESCCRNKICKHSGIISREGDIIACAPNNVLIRIENA